jgi:predicted nuclease of predicted toxin-antitoxin system
MRFLIDAQLPPELANWMRQKGFEASAVRDIGLRDGTDGAIWTHAIETDAIIVTKDKDFAIRRNAASDGPQVLWLTMGNTINRVLLERLTHAWNEIEARLKDGSGVVEVR